MAKEGRFDRHTLKEDEVGDIALVLFKKLRDNKQAILVALVAIVVAIVGINVYRSYKTQALISASEYSSQAHALMEQARAAENEDVANDYYKRAVKKYQELINKYPKGRDGIEAIFLQGNCHYEMDNFDGAINSFLQYVEKVRSAADKAKAYLALGYTVENKFFRTNEADLIGEAIEYFERAFKIGEDTYLANQALLSLGRSFELTNQNEKAVEMYRKIIDRKPVGELAPISPYAQVGSEKTAREKLERLELLLQAKQ